MKFPYNPVLTIQAEYKAGKITREEAKEKLAFLLDLDSNTDMCEEALPDYQRTPGAWKQSYGPLVRLSDVCAVFRMWAGIFSTPLPEDSEYKKKEREEIREHWSRIDLTISKSNFLARLFFTDENLRTEQCPVHKGKWCGCFGEGKEGPCPCQSGGNVTGWLAVDKKYEDLQYWDAEKGEYRKRSQINEESPRIG